MPPLPNQDYGPRRGRGSPVVIDAGAWHMKEGWAGEEQPAPALPSVLAKTQREKGRESELLVGSDISNMESVWYCVTISYFRPHWDPPPL